jgi:hypothetical protein
MRKCRPSSLYIQKRPTTVSKETYYSVKRDLEHEEVPPLKLVHDLIVKAPSGFRWLPVYVYIYIYIYIYT